MDRPVGGPVGGSEQANASRRVSGDAPPKRVNLALQGAGAHGAFTWGVLDRLLEDGRLRFEGVSGTSAGAINGAALVYGLHAGGPDKARRVLSTLWTRLAQAALLMPLQPTWYDRLVNNPNLDMSPAYMGFDMLIRMLSPYQFNPAGYNPLRDLLSTIVDFRVLRAARDPQLYVSATNVARGKLKIFAGEELSVDALLASACLPFLFQAVHIQGEQYWDGGYMGNPTLHPLIHDCDSSDVVVIQINPIYRKKIPTTTTAIVDRMNEISFNASFMREVRSMALINRLIDEGALDGEAAGLRRIFLHMIGNETQMRRYTVSSKMNGDWVFVHDLRDLGRLAATRWLEDNLDHVGVESTFDVDSIFL